MARTAMNRLLRLQRVLRHLWDAGYRTKRTRLGLEMREHFHRDYWPEYEAKLRQRETCRFGHPILRDGYCEFGHIRPVRHCDLYPTRK
jgi:hypothetical protein